MERIEVSTVTKQFLRTFSEASLNELGKATRLCRREREATPFRLMLALLESFATGALDSIADIHRAFNALCERQMRYKPFHNQLSKPGFPVFMRLMLTRLLNELACEVLRFSPRSPFARFEQIRIQDGTSFALKPTLAATFPGRFTTISPAAVELHVDLDLLSEGLNAVTLSADSEGERQFLPAPEELAGSLLLADRGYVSIDYLRATDNADGRFIIRGKSDMNPLILNAFGPDGEELERFQGQRLSALKKRLSKYDCLDMTVRFGKGAKAFVCRLIVHPNLRRNDVPRYLLTNLERDAFAPEHVSDGYRLRWQIGVSSQGHIIQSVEVRPGLRDSGPVAWEAPWRESKTVEPSDNILRKEDAQRTRLQRAVNVDVASSHAIPVAETVDNARRQQGPFETSPIRRPSPAGYQRRHGAKDFVSTGEALVARRRKLVEEARPITVSGKWRRRRQGGGSGRNTGDRRATQRAGREGPGPVRHPLCEVR